MRPKLQKGERSRLSMMQKQVLKELKANGGQLDLLTLLSTLRNPKEHELHQATRYLYEALEGLEWMGHLETVVEEPGALQEVRSMSDFSPLDMFFTEGGAGWKWTGGPFKRSVARVRLSDDGLQFAEGLG